MARKKARGSRGRRREDNKTRTKRRYGYGSIPIHTIFRGMNIHLPAILMFTRGIGFWPIPIWWWPDGPFLENEQMTSIDWTPWSPQGHRQAATAEALLPVGIPKAEWSSRWALDHHHDFRWLEEKEVNRFFILWWFMVLYGSIWFLMINESTLCRKWKCWICLSWPRPGHQAGILQ